MSIKEQEKVAVVTGSSSGIGFETSLLLAKNGFRTFATVRNLDKSNAIRNISDKGELPIQVVELDVNSDKSVNAAINIDSNNVICRLYQLFPDLGQTQYQIMQESLFQLWVLYLYLLLNLTNFLHRP